jgi:zinc transport system substrate-binding protein
VTLPGSRVFRRAGVSGVRVSALVCGLGLLALVLAGVACKPADRAPASPTSGKARADKVAVFVSILPQVYFVERVGGNLVEVEALVLPGQSPATYEPTPKQMAALSEADVFFSIGVPYERRLLPRIAAALGELRVVDTREGITLRQMEDHNHDGESEGHDQAGAPDPHVWLDPRLVKIQAGTICRELCRLDPAHKADFERNLEAFSADLDAVHARITEVLAPLKGEEFFVFHPAYGYFADAYGLIQVAVEMGGKEPSQKQLVELIDKAREAGARLIFVQPQFSTRSAQAIAKAIDGAVVPLDPLAEDYLENLTDMASKIEESLSGPAAPDS